MNNNQDEINMNNNQDEIVNNRDNDKLKSNNNEDSLVFGIAVLADLTRMEMERSLPYLNHNQK